MPTIYIYFLQQCHVRVLPSLFEGGKNQASADWNMFFTHLHQPLQLLPVFAPELCRRKEIPHDAHGGTLWTHVGSIDSCTGRGPSTIGNVSDTGNGLIIKHSLGVFQILIINLFWIGFFSKGRLAHVCATGLLVFYFVCSLPSFGFTHDSIWWGVGFFWDSEPVHSSPVGIRVHQAKARISPCSAWRRYTLEANMS